MSCADEMELLHFIGATGRATVQAMSQGSPPYDVANAAGIPMKSATVLTFKLFVRVQLRWNRSIDLVVYLVLLAIACL